MSGFAALITASAFSGPFLKSLDPRWMFHTRTRTLSRGIEANPVAIAAKIVNTVAMLARLPKTHSKFARSTKGPYERKIILYPSILQASFFDADEGQRDFERRCSVGNPAWAVSMIGHFGIRSLPLGQGLTSRVAVAILRIVNP